MTENRSYLSKRAAIVFTALLFASSAAQALTIGPAQTKNERERHTPSSKRYPSGSYETVMEHFLKGQFKESERLAASFRPRPGDNRAEEVAMIRALSLMKLGRFEEARPILETLQNQSSSAELRAQAAYSLGDSFYFQNDRSQADIYYRQAVERYPDHGEAQQVRRLLGLSHPASVTMPLRQTGVEENLIYSVQVGSFSKRRNAERLLNKLMRKRLDAYILQDEASKNFRVRIGHLTMRADAESLEARLKKDGYPTKIFP